MVNYREIIRLKSLEYSNARVASSCGSSRNTVAEVWQLAERKELIWPIPVTLTNMDLQQILIPERSVGLGRKTPDYEYIFKELAKPGVTLSLHEILSDLTSSYYEYPAYGIYLALMHSNKDPMESDEYVKHLLNTAKGRTVSSQY